MTTKCLIITELEVFFFWLKSYWIEWNKRVNSQGSRRDTGDWEVFLGGPCSSPLIIGLLSPLNIELSLQKIFFAMEKFFSAMIKILRAIQYASRDQRGVKTEGYLVEIQYWNYYR